MATLQINAQTRTGTGKGTARKLRNVGRLPAVLYGPQVDSVLLSIDYPQLRKTLRGKSAENIIFDLNVDVDGVGQTKKAMIKEIQKDPVTREYLHVDLYEISMGKEMEADVPIHLLNTPIGVTNGGVLQHVRRELKVSCMPENLVEHIEIDVSGLDIGDSLHIYEVSFPFGLRSTEDESLGVVTVVAPTKAAEEEEEIGEGEEEGTKAESERTGGEEES